MKNRIAIALAVALILPSPLLAQPLGRGFGMGPGMMAWDRMGSGFCGPRTAGLAEWRIEAMEQAVKPTDEQRKLLGELKSASIKARDAIAQACPREWPESPVARLDFMERRLAAMLDGIKTVRPAFTAFYASLSDEQKAQLKTAWPHHWGWRFWHDSSTD